MVKRVVQMWAPVVAILSACATVILAANEFRLWPLPLFVITAMISLRVLSSRWWTARATRRWTVRRVIGAAAAAVTATTAAVTGLLLLSYTILGLPLDDDDIELTCSERRAHPRADPLSAGERPTRVFFEDGGVIWNDSKHDVLPDVQEEDLTSVQQVACLRRVASIKHLATCRYSEFLDAGPYHASTRYQGRWELDVREARTGATIAIRHLDGELDTTCPPAKFVRESGTVPDDYSQPSAADIRDALATK